MIPDDHCTHKRGDVNGLVKMDSISPFLSQFISFICQYCMMHVYPSYSDFIRSTQVSKACIPSQSCFGDGFASVVITALLSGQIYILSFTFLNRGVLFSSGLPSLHFETLQRGFPLEYSPCVCLSSAPKQFPLASLNPLHCSLYFDLGSLSFWLSLMAPCTLIYVRDCT